MATRSIATRSAGESALAESFSGQLPVVSLEAMTGPQRAAVILLVLYTRRYEARA